MSVGQSEVERLREEFDGDEDDPGKKESFFGPTTYMRRGVNLGNYIMNLHPPELPGEEELAIVDEAGCLERL